MSNIRVSKQGWELIPREDTEDYKAHRRAMQRLDAMTLDERFQTFVDAGIYTQEGELTKRYGGDAPDKQD